MLDTRATPYSDPHAFEQAVRGAASILHLLAANGLPPLLWAGGPQVLLPGEEAMAALASVRTDPDRPFPAAVDVRGTIVLITGRPDEQSRAWVSSHDPGAVLAVSRAEAVGTLLGWRSLMPVTQLSVIKSCDAAS